VRFSIKNLIIKNHNLIFNILFKFSKNSFPLLYFYCLFFHFINIAKASEIPTITVVQSRENAGQWTGITNRLQTMGVKYCAIPITSIKSFRDWGDRKVLFLPNVEVLSPAQAIALEEWVSKGGRVIVSGPVASLSASGVRQLMQNLLGAYWGFPLNEAQRLQPPKENGQDWARQSQLFGAAHGGVIVKNESVADTAAVWDGKDAPAAVVTTERSIFLGWRWGVDTASNTELDTAWLKAAINRQAKSDTGSDKVKEASDNCPTSVALAPVENNQPIQKNQRGENQRVENQRVENQRSGNQRVENQRVENQRSGNQRVENQRNRPVENQQTIATGGNSLLQLPNPSPINRSDEAIDQLEQSVRLDINPASSAPISRGEGIALQQELQNLIGRVESANLTAIALSGTSSTTRLTQATFASTKGGAAVANTNIVIQQAREVANNLPQLIAQKKFAQARQQWLAAKSNLWNQFPLEKSLAQPEIRAVWLDRGTIVRARGLSGLTAVFDRLAQAGINTVFFETINAGYPIYPSSIAPQQNPLIRGWDPLASAVKLAKERGIEIHAWVWAFAAGNQRHNEVIGLKSDYPGPVLAAHPDWAGYDNRGRPIPQGQGKPFFDPANPQVREYLLNIYEEIATRYDVDGIHLDYIRYPFQDPKANRTYGYGKAAREQFQQLTGVDPTKISPNQGEIWNKWTAFRTNQIDSFVAQTSQRLRAKKPNLIISAAVFPLPQAERIQKLQQNWELWARRGDVDLIVPMTYALDTTRFQRLAHPWIASNQLGSSLLVPGIRLLSLPTIGAFDQIQLVRDLPTSGYALFAAENFGNDLHRVFSKTQGNLSSTGEPIPHRQPFLTAALRYQALQKEWQFFQQNSQLPLPIEFQKQAEVLQTALNQLAEKPDSSRLVTAKGSLNRFQFQFNIWMKQQAAENPYQVKVWENRLETIERLLLFGERRLANK
jgi:uncharacterized lipoprotein YddW (UPF0748 family)